MIPFNKTDGLREYLAEHWRRAYEARQDQIEQDYPKWDANYRGEPAEKERSIPWRNSSNIVIPVIRMFVDTFVARTLNVVFATRPLVQVEGAQSDITEGLEAYLNLKCRQDWDLYGVARTALYSGNKHGTAMVKVPWVNHVVNVYSEAGPQPVTRYRGPKPSHVAFDDWFLYPITAQSLDQALIKFNVIRLAEETARERAAEDWKIDDGQLEQALKTPDDVKREREAENANVGDYRYREMKVVECYLEWKESRVVVEYDPVNEIILRAYFDPTPVQCRMFHAYRPFPREDIFPGESACEVLGVFQEEISTIHNDRRNLSTLASAPQFIIKDGARMPNASTNWYPGKCWIVDEIDDFRIEQIRAGYQDMMAEEQQAFQLVEKVSGVGGLMMGHSQGQMGKGGVYNAAGTIAVMAESNQRQNTNIRDFRLFLGEVVKDCFLLQRDREPDDPTIGQLTGKQQEQVKQAMEMQDDEWARTVFEVRMSDSAANKEIEKANLLMLANTLSQYGQQAQGLVSMMHAQNPVLQKLGKAQAQMAYSTAYQLLKDLGQAGIAEDLPNVAEIFTEEQQAKQQQQQQQPAAPGGMGPPPGFGRP